MLTPTTVFATGAAAFASSESGDRVELRIATGGEAGELAGAADDASENEARGTREAKLTRLRTARH